MGLKIKSFWTVIFEDVIPYKKFDSTFADFSALEPFCEINHPPTKFAKIRKFPIISELALNPATLGDIFLLLPDYYVQR